MSIKAFIFDCGGVMTDNPDDTELDKYLQAHWLAPGDNVEKVKLTAYRSGLTAVQFWGGYAKKRDKQLPTDWQQKLIALMEASIRPRQEMYDLVAALKRKNFKVAMLTNITPLYDEILKARKVYAPFEDYCCVRSCEIGYDKPNPEAYKAILSKMEEFTPEQIGFIDDKQPNAAAAEVQKMHGITFTDISKLKNDLKTRFAIEV